MHPTPDVWLFWTGVALAQLTGAALVVLAVRVWWAGAWR